MSFASLVAPHLPALTARLADLVRPADPFGVQSGARGPGSELLEEMALDQLATGGKRLRGLLPPALVAAADGPVAAAVELGACIELVHNGTLVHDDVQDRDCLRRGQPTLWTRYGEAQAVNAGTFLMVQAIAHLTDADAILDRHRATLAGMLAMALAETLRGQVADLALHDKTPADLDTLAAIHVAKTAPLFAGCLCGAAVLLDQPLTAQPAAAAAARELGLGFQIRDDLLDVVGHKGRERGADLREGKVTWPAALALRRFDDATGRDLRAVLRAAAHGQGEPEVEVWLERIVATGAAEQARADLERVLEQAVDHARRALPDASAAVVGALCERLRVVDG
jgi:geranylgeranyl pyrophosphate synthase